MVMMPVYYLVTSKLMERFLDTMQSLPWERGRWRKMECCQGKYARGWPKNFMVIEKNNDHLIPFHGDLILSLTHGIIYNTRVSGQNTCVNTNNDVANVYTGWMIDIGDEKRIARCVYGHCGSCKELVLYRIKIGGWWSHI